MKTLAFEGLSERLEAAFKRLKSKGSLNEADVRAAMRDVRMALLEADVSYKVAKDFTAKVTERAIGADVMESLTPAQMVIKMPSNMRPSTRAVSAMDSFLPIWLPE